MLHSDLLEYTTWKIKFAQQEEAAIREARRKQEAEELLRREQSLEAGIHSLSHSVTLSFIYLLTHSLRKLYELLEAE